MQETAGASGEIPAKSRCRGHTAPCPADVLTAGMRFDFCAVRSVGDLPRCTHTCAFSGAMTCPPVGSLVAPDHLAQGGNTAVSFFFLREPAAFRSFRVPARRNNERQSAKGLAIRRLFYILNIDSVSRKPPGGLAPAIYFITHDGIDWNKVNYFEILKDR